MEPIKRLEIVIESAQEHAVVERIARSGIDGYTLFREVAGYGGRGDRDADGLTSVFQNVCFIVAAPPDAAQHLIEAIRPLLAESGGICLVSDAMWLDH
jgi:PII-like signaling protein